MIFVSHVYVGTKGQEFESLLVHKLQLFLIFFLGSSTLNPLITYLEDTKYYLDTNLVQCRAAFCMLRGSRTICVRKLVIYSFAKTLGPIPK